MSTSFPILSHVRDYLEDLDMTLPKQVYTGDHFCTFRRYCSHLLIIALLKILKKNDFDYINVDLHQSNYDILNQLYLTIYATHGPAKDLHLSSVQEYIKKKAFVQFRTVNRGYPTMRVRREAGEDVKPHTLEELLSESPPVDLIQNEKQIRAGEKHLLTQAMLVNFLERISFLEKRIG